MKPSDSFPEISVSDPVCWDASHSLAAVALAEGKTQVEAAGEANITDRTLRNWLQNVEFSEEVDRLSLMIGAASKAERIRIAKRVIAQKCKSEAVETDRDLLDWFKYLQSETTGIVINWPRESKSTSEPALPPSMAGRQPSSSESESIN